MGGCGGYCSPRAGSVSGGHPDGEVQTAFAVRQAEDRWHGAGSPHGHFHAAVPGVCHLILGLDQRIVLAVGFRLDD